MKKNIVLCVFILFVMSACSLPSIENEGNIPDNNPTVDPLQDFKDYIAATEGSPGRSVEVKAFLDTLMGLRGTGKVPETETADALVLEYLSYLEEILLLDQSDLSKYPEEAGFKFALGEGGSYPVINYHFIDAYSGQVSQEVLDFAEFMALDSDKSWALDAGIVIPIRELADRTAQAEKFIASYPDFILKDQVLIKYEYYLDSFLAGLPNTPLFPFGSYKAELEFIEAYDYFLETYPEMITAETIRNYQLELEEMNYTAPYTYLEYEKRDEFLRHIYELVKNTMSSLNQQIDR